MSIPTTGVAWPFSQPTKGVTVYEQDTIPENPRIGDVWYDTSPQALHLIKKSETLLQVLGPPNTPVSIALVPAVGVYGGVGRPVGRTNSNGHAYITPPLLNQYSVTQPATGFMAGWYSAFDELTYTYSPEILQAGTVTGYNSEARYYTWPVEVYNDLGPTPGQVVTYSSDPTGPGVGVEDTRTFVNTSGDMMEMQDTWIAEGWWGLPVGFKQGGAVYVELTQFNSVDSVYAVAKPVVGQQYPPMTLVKAAPVGTGTIVDITALTKTHWALQSIGAWAPNTYPSAGNPYSNVSAKVKSDSVVAETGIKVDINFETDICRVTYANGDPCAWRQVISEVSLAQGEWDGYYSFITFCLTDANGEFRMADYLWSDGSYYRIYGSQPTEPFLYEGPTP